MKKLLIIAAFLLGSSAVAMDKPSALKPWVTAASTISVRTATKTLSEKIDISDTTTVFNIKEALLDREGIPTAQQELRTLSANPSTLWLTDKISSNLEDTESIKAVMNRYNTDRFLLLIKLASKN